MLVAVVVHVLIVVELVTAVVNSWAPLQWAELIGAVAQLMLVA